MSLLSFGEECDGIDDGIAECDACMEAGGCEELRFFELFFLFSFFFFLRESSVGCADGAFIFDMGTECDIVEVYEM